MEFDLTPVRNIIFGFLALYALWHLIPIGLNAIGIVKITSEKTKEEVEGNATAGKTVKGFLKGNGIALLLPLSLFLVMAILSLAGWDWARTTFFSGVNWLLGYFGMQPIPYQ